MKKKNKKENHIKYQMNLYILNFLILISNYNFILIIYCWMNIQINLIYKIKKIYIKVRLYFIKEEKQSKV